MSERRCSVAGARSYLANSKKVNKGELSMVKQSAVFFRVKSVVAPGHFATLGRAIIRCQHKGRGAGPAVFLQKEEMGVFLQNLRPMEVSHFHDFFPTVSHISFSRKLRGRDHTNHHHHPRLFYAFSQSLEFTLGMMRKND